MAVNDGGVPPILAQKHYTQPSAFTPENLLREARRQKRITGSSIPDICVLDPDGDMVRSLIARGEARLESGWACYHTELYSFSRDRIDLGAQRRIRWIPVPVLTGATWTTDAPFRETQPAIDAMVKRNLMAVEMEAAALYAFAQVRQKPVLCFAHVTNQMGRVDGDFEKGEADGSHQALQLIAIAAGRLRSRLLP